jgi:hypothetical protein
MSKQIPQGIEVLVKKASVDPGFKELLLRDRAAATETIGLLLDPAEAAMLAAITADQLEAIIARTVVPPEHRRVFLGKTAATMLAVLGASVVLCTGLLQGARPDRPALTGGSRPDAEHPTPGSDVKEPLDMTRGIRSGGPEPK